MSSMYKKMLNFLFNLDYWENYRRYKKVKNILIYFFKNNDSELQKSFVKNFKYPTDMVQPPVRFEPKSGDIYYTLNFTNKEIFESLETKEKTMTNSLYLLDKLLPLGVTNYLEPQPVVHIPDTFSLLCSVKVISEVNLKKTIFMILDSFVVNSAIIGIIFVIYSVLLKYFEH